jgi:ABC-2 type transport system permease protein
MGNTLTIARRELFSFFDSLVAYVVVGLSMITVGLWFFVANGGIWQIDRANFTRMFEALPWLLAVLVIPLVTMRSLAEEKRSGTLELLITMPVKDSEVILGKYIAALAMCVVLILCSLVYPFAMFVKPWHLGSLDWGPIWSGVLGLTLFSAAGCAIGLLFSSITESQIIAFFFTAFLLGLLVVLGLLAQWWHGVPGDICGFLSFESRFEGFARGLIDTRAVIYFLSIAVLCLFISFRSLESRKWT